MGPENIKQKSLIDNKVLFFLMYSTIIYPTSKLQT